MYFFVSVKSYLKNHYDKSEISHQTAHLNDIQHNYKMSLYWNNIKVKKIVTIIIICHYYYMSNHL